MSKNKLQKFAENLSFNHLFQPEADELRESGLALRGRWRDEFFRNQNPIVLELGCGKGDYSVALASIHPESNFIGIDIKGARLWRGCKSSKELGLVNIAFVRTKIQNIDLLFAPAEVDSIWITFPDPQPRASKAEKRLTSPPFLSKYAAVLKPGGIIHLKTDNAGLFEYTREILWNHGHNILQESRDIYADGLDGPITAIQTFYEKMWLDQNLKIHYISFTINSDE